MCDFASLIVTKDRVFWSKNGDNHTAIAEEHGLHEDGAKGPNVVKVEITPPGGQWWTDRKGWAFRVDQDILPEWWDAKDGEARARVALEDLAAARLFDGRDAEVKEGMIFARNSTVKAWGSATVEASGSATVKAWGSATVKAWDSATVKAWGPATVKASGSATVIGYSPTRHKLADLAVLVDRSKAGTVTCETTLIKAEAEAAYAVKGSVKL